MSDSLFDTQETSSLSLIEVIAPEPTIPEKEILAKEILLSRGDKFGSYISKLCVFTRSHLHIFQAEGGSAYEGSINLHHMRCDYTIDDSTATNKYELKFRRDLLSEDLLTKDPANFKKLKNVLAGITIQTDFHSKFKTLSKIGEGSFGSVYRVRKIDTNEEFAVKQFDKAALIKSKTAKGYLFKEIQIMKELDHPCLLKLHEVHETRNSIYLLVDLLEGGELFDILGAFDGPLPLTDACLIMKQCLEGLSYMASKNIIHLDIKPDNLIFRHKGKSVADNQLVICDFGLSTFADEILTAKCGTPGYIAPELLTDIVELEKLILTPAVDIFSMGIIFYILLAGFNPFQTTGCDNCLIKNVKCEIDYANPSIAKNHPYCIKMIRNMLSKTPEARISAQEAIEMPLFSGSTDMGVVLIKHDYALSRGTGEIMDPRLKDMMAGEKQHSRRCSLKISPSGDSVKSGKSLKSKASVGSKVKRKVSDSDSDNNSAQSNGKGKPTSPNFIYEGKEPIARSSSGKRIDTFFGNADSSLKSPKGNASSKITGSPSGNKLAYTDSGKRTSAFAGKR